MTTLDTTRNRQDARILQELKDLAEAGKIRPVIDRTYTLQDTPDAVRYLEAGHARGKVVIAL